MAHQGREPANGSPALAAALLASVATMVQLVMVLGIANRGLLGRMTVAPVAAGAVLVLEAMVVGRHASESPESVESAASRPFALAPAVLLGGAVPEEEHGGRVGLRHRRRPVAGPEVSGGAGDHVRRRAARPLRGRRRGG